MEQDFIIEKGVLTNYSGTRVRIAIPEGVAEIGPSVFHQCKFLQEVWLPDGVELIGAHAFSGSGLQRIHLPGGLLSIGHSAFSRCDNLEELLLPDTVEEIGSLAFYSCTRLSRLTLPAQLKTLEHGVFQNCWQLEEADVPDGVSRISDYAFCGCQSLYRLRLPPSVREIGQSAFLRCEGLRAIDDPNYARHAPCFAQTPYARWARRWAEQFPHQPVPGIFPFRFLEPLTGSWPGGLLRAMGLGFFDPRRTYVLSSPDENGVVEVSSWCGEESADEDGFGREECYDWWLLDRHLNPIPGIPGLHGYSSFDMRASSTSKYWKALRAQAGETVKRG